MIQTYNTNLQVILAFNGDKEDLTASKSQRVEYPEPELHVLSSDGQIVSSASLALRGYTQYRVRTLSLHGYSIVKNTTVCDCVGNITTTEYEIISPVLHFDSPIVYSAMITLLSF